MSHSARGALAAGVVIVSLAPVPVAGQAPGTQGQVQPNTNVGERWTRIGPEMLEYVVTIEDPTTWTRSWTVKQEFSRQSDEANRIYMEPRCHEGNHGLVGILTGARAQEKAFAEGRGPDPATLGGGGGGLGGEENQDPLR